MITATVDTSVFNYGIAGLIHKVGLQSRVVIEKETGELMKTLVRTSPPRDPKKTRESIKKSVSQRFNSLASQDSEFESKNAKLGGTGVKWYAATDKFLYGVAPDSDMRNATVETLRKVLYRAKTVAGKTRIVVPFKHPRKLQRVAILTKVLVKKAQQTALITRISKNIGRLKAAWLVAATNGPIKLSGGNQPPGWVLRHAQGAKGRYINGLADPAKPTFTIANFAKGIGQRQVNGLVQLALNIRAKAIQANIGFFLSGRKKLSDYIR